MTKVYRTLDEYVSKRYQNIICRRSIPLCKLDQVILDASIDRRAQKRFRGRVHCYLLERLRIPKLENTLPRRSCIIYSRFLINGHLQIPT